MSSLAAHIAQNPRTSTQALVALAASVDDPYGRPLEDDEVVALAIVHPNLPDGVLRPKQRLSNHALIRRASALPHATPATLERLARALDPGALEYTVRFDRDCPPGFVTAWVDANRDKHRAGRYVNDTYTAADALVALPTMRSRDAEALLGSLADSRRLHRWAMVWVASRTKKLWQVARRDENKRLQLDRISPTPMNRAQAREWLLADTEEMLADAEARMDAGLAGIWAKLVKLTNDETLAEAVWARCPHPAVMRSMLDHPTLAGTRAAAQAWLELADRPQSPPPALDGGVVHPEFLEQIIASPHSEHSLREVAGRADLTAAHLRLLWERIVDKPRVAVAWQETALSIALHPSCPQDLRAWVLKRMAGVVGATGTSVVLPALYEVASHLGSMSRQEACAMLPVPALAQVAHAGERVYGTLLDNVVGEALAGALDVCTNADLAFTSVRMQATFAGTLGELFSTARTVLAQ